MAHTLCLTPKGWDLQLDGRGSIKTVSGTEATLQNVACAVRLFTQDAYLNGASGVPHFDTDISTRLNSPILGARINRAARSVKGVLHAQTELARFDERKLEATIRVTTENGATETLSLQRRT